MNPDEEQKKKKEEEEKRKKEEEALKPEQVPPKEGPGPENDSLQTQPAIVVSKETPTAPVPAMAIEPSKEQKDLPQNKHEISTCPTCGRPKGSTECYYCSRQKSKRPRMFEE